jgi:hypothetical protein
MTAQQERAVGVQKCWCGTRNPYYAPLPRRCEGYGHIDCLCGGDFCVCHHHGGIECDGCVDCEELDDSDIGEGDNWR